MASRRLQWTALLNVIPENQRVLVQTERMQAWGVALAGFGTIAVGFVVAAIEFSRDPNSPIGVVGVFLAFFGIFIGHAGTWMVAQAYSRLKVIAARERPDLFDTDGEFVGGDGDGSSSSPVSEEDLLRAQGSQ